MATLSKTPFTTDRAAGAGDSAQGLTAFEAEIVAMFADLVVLLGLPKSMGEIYGLLFASAEPLTFGEIEQKLGLSKGSVSQGLKSLRELGAVLDVGPQPGDGESRSGSPRSVSEVDDRTGRPSGGAGNNAGAVALKAHWVATTELRKLIGSLLRDRISPYLERQDQRVASAATALSSLEGNLSDSSLAILENRLGKLKKWQSQARGVLPIISKML